MSNPKLAVRIASKINQLYRYLILVSIAVGGLFPQFGPFLKPLVPYLTAIMVATLTMACTKEDLLRTIKEPSSIALGLILIFVLTPFLSYLISFFFLRPYSEIAAGLMLVASAPCAWAVGIWAGLAGGEVMLALTLAVTSAALSSVLIPFLMALLAGAYVSLDVFGMLKDLALMVIVPMILAAILKSKIVKETKEANPLFFATSSVIAMILGATVAAVVLPLLWSQGTGVSLVSLIVATAVQGILSFALGYTIPYFVFKRDLRRSITLTYATGSRNNALAMAIALRFFPVLSALPSIIYLILQVIVSSLMLRKFEKMHTSAK